MRYFLPLLIAAAICSAQPALKAQTYQAPDVVISKEKVNIGGKIYYIHKVEPKQTIYSICKAYDVTEEELIEANPILKEGLKSGSSIFIPVKEAEPVQAMEQSSNTGRKKNWFEKAFSSNKKKDNRKSEEELEPEITEEATAGDTLVLAMAVTEASATPENFTIYSKSNPLKVSLLLPLNASKENPATNYFDFYCGALMAADKLKKEGYSLELSVYDIKAEAAYNNPRLAESDLIIGPVHQSDMMYYAPYAKEHQIPIVSPMDGSTRKFMEDNPYFFFAPAADSVQLAQAVASIKPAADEKIYVFYNSTLKEKALVDRVKARLDESGIEYYNLAYDLLKGRELGQNLRMQWAGRGKYKIIVASEDEAFAPDVIRNIRLIARGNIPIQIYCPNSLRNFEGSMDYDSFHASKAHISAPYFVDYTEPETHDFVYKYRALFNTEPTAFAFQGHDILSYFVTALTQCGGRIEDIASLETKMMLQCNLHFEQQDKKSGWQNTATRNLIYNPDFSISVEQ